MPDLYCGDCGQPCDTRTFDATGPGDTERYMYLSDCCEDRLYVDEELTREWDPVDDTREQLAERESDRRRGQ